MHTSEALLFGVTAPSHQHHVHHVPPVVSGNETTCTTSDSHSVINSHILGNLGGDFIRRFSGDYTKLKA